MIDNDLSAVCGNGLFILEENVDYFIVIMLMTTMLLFLANKYNQSIDK
jgi:hypothetical protein